MAYMNGRDCVQDECRAYELYEKAARNNHAKSICSLGYMNEVGLGTPVDKERAVAYYQQAADLDDEVAACNFAYCCYEGIGCEMCIRDRSYDLEEEMKKGDFSYSQMIGKVVALKEKAAVHQDYLNDFFALRDHLYLQEQRAIDELENINIV